MQDSVQTQQWASVLQQLAQWVVAGITWTFPILEKVFGFVLQGDSFWDIAWRSVLLFLPAGAFALGLLFSVISLYTIPFRLGRSVTLMHAMGLAWWDTIRMVWFYWAGLGRFLLMLVGWVLGLLKLTVQLVWGTLKGAVTSPLAMLDATSRRAYRGRRSSCSSSGRRWKRRSSRSRSGRR
jgi:hypothetical protein